jgi:hypothetical protein
LPYNICVLVPIIAIYWYLLRYYRKSAVDLQRLDAVSRSPVQANLVEGEIAYSNTRYQHVYTHHFHLFLHLCVSITFSSTMLMLF